MVGLQPLESVGQCQHRVWHCSACVPSSGCHMGGPKIFLPDYLPFPGECCNHLPGTSQAALRLEG